MPQRYLLDYVHSSHRSTEDTLRPSKTQKNWCTYEFRELEAAGTGHAQICTTWQYWEKLPFRTQKLSPIYKVKSSKWNTKLVKWNFFFFFLVFWVRVFLCRPGCPGIHFVDQAGLELRNPPASASQVLGLKACATTARLFFFFVLFCFVLFCFVFETGFLCVALAVLELTL